MGSQESDATEQLNTHTHTHTHTRKHTCIHMHTISVKPALPHFHRWQMLSPHFFHHNLQMCCVIAYLVGLLLGSGSSRAWGLLTDGGSSDGGRGSAIRLTAPAEPKAQGWGALISEDSGRGCSKGL